MANNLSTKTKILNAIEQNKKIANDELRTEFEQAWELAEETLETIVRLSPKIDQSVSDDDDIILLLAINILGDALSALLQIEEGYIRPPAIILRGALENLAALTVFGDNADYLEQFKRGDYLTQKAIGPSKKFFPHIGELYGLLNQFTHEKIESLGRGLIPLDKPNFGLALIQPFNSSLQIRLIDFTTTITYTLGLAFESVLFKRIQSIHPSDLYYWDITHKRTLKAKEVRGAEIVRQISKSAGKRSTQS